MNNDLDWCLNKAGELIDTARRRLDKDETIGLTDELISTLEELDEKYREYCYEIDNDDDLDSGTTYKAKSGPRMEFYVEANDWHKISKALRTLKKN